MRAALFFAGCLIAAVAGAAAAQPAQPPPQPSSLYEARDDAAWQLYHEAFGALLEGKRKRAAGLAERLRREHAGHPATAMIDSSPLAAEITAERARRSRGEEPTSAASAELALFQTLHGIIVGVELCLLFECDDAGPYLGLSLAGGAAGAVASLKAVDRLTSGQRALLNSGTFWGAFNAGMVLIAADPGDAPEAAAGMLAGQAIGLTAGALMFRWRPTSGQVGIANTGGQWAAVLMGLTLAAAQANVSDGELSLSLMLAADAGLGVGAYLAKQWPDIGRARGLVIDAGGIVGGVGGGGIGVLISGAVDEQTTAAMAAVGVAVGLGTAAYFTRSWGDSEDDGGGASGPRAMVMPVEHGRGGLIGLAGSW